jgi:Mg2+/Co2+ transporter CorB
LKENVDKIYLKIKVCRKNRNRVREIIDLKEMEIDDLQFEIDKMKSISKLRVWNY